ncbi:MAG TPA: hypothetical protein VF881_07720 [Polyangiaceae bacterium]
MGVPRHAPVALSHVAFCKHSSQAIGTPPVQVVLWHFSPVVHGSPSSHVAPVLGSALHPVALSHELIVQGFVSEQFGAGPGVQRPF